MGTNSNKWRNVQLMVKMNMPGPDQFLESSHLLVNYTQILSQEANTVTVNTAIQNIQNQITHQMKTMTERMRRRNILELSRMRHEQKLSEQSLKSGRRQLGRMVDILILLMRMAFHWKLHQSLRTDLRNWELNLKPQKLCQIHENFK